MLLKRDVEDHSVLGPLEHNLVEQCIFSLAGQHLPSRRSRVPLHTIVRHIRGGVLKYRIPSIVQVTDSVDPQVQTRKPDLNQEVAKVIRPLNPNYKQLVESERANFSPAGGDGGASDKER